MSFQPGGEGDWVTAVPNRPLTTGDNLWTDQGSRAEMHVGSTAIRLAPETSVTLLDLDDRTTQLRLSAGTVILRVRHLDDGDVVEVDTPNLAFNLQHPGEYRIDVDSNGDMTNVSVWSGRGEVTGGGYSYTVVAGQSARFSGTDQLNYDIAQLPGSDDFDNWAFQRDHREDGAESANYVSSEMTGYEDLDDYGHWQYVGGYGTVWVPAGVASDWAPYRNGHWAYIDPWGWTWVEDEPWGFAPFHYGRWAYAGNRWCWVPGPVAVRPVYAPALVAFVGGVGISVGGGPGVGWFPLAPGEVYVPYYRGSRGYVERVNVTNTVVNVTRVTNVYNRAQCYEHHLREPAGEQWRHVSFAGHVRERATGIAESGAFRRAATGECAGSARRPGAAGQGQRIGLGRSGKVQTAAGDREPPGSGDPETGSSPAAFRAATGGRQCAHGAA